MAFASFLILLVMIFTAISAGTTWATITQSGAGDAEGYLSPAHGITLCMLLFWIGADRCEPSP
jgi:hypothetical protein